MGFEGGCKSTPNSWVGVVFVSISFIGVLERFLLPYRPGKTPLASFHWPPHAISQVRSCGTESRFSVPASEKIFLWLVVVITSQSSLKASDDAFGLARLVIVCVKIGLLVHSGLRLVSSVPAGFVLRDDFGCAQSVIRGQGFVL
ncbi:hypothetical protein YC2023_041527 [Brassica napus]